MGKRPTQALGRRFFAQIIDGLVITAIIGGIAFAKKDLTIDHGTLHSHVNVGDQLLYAGIALLYFFLMEWLFGATIGKFICGIRVVKKSGGRIGVFNSLVRNVLRLVDELPFGIYLVGWVSAMATGQDDRARLGDLAGGTRVVRKSALGEFHGGKFQGAPIVPS
jgi:uncharacterized RDD family membrane protein YckC